MTTSALPLRTAIGRRDHNQQTVFEWATDHPPLHARYRLEWRFRTHSRSTPAPRPPTGAAAPAHPGAR
jgi:hypothetical protein